jgi:hypothetical protein
MPYREDKPIAEIIPPDRRRRNTILLVVASMTIGACALWAVQQLVPKDPPKIIVEPSGGDFSGATLEGPDGTLTIPPRGRRSVVHVWLQGCADCMPAFEAMKKIEAENGLGSDVNVVNVAYGTADPSWAAQYGVRKNLVFDRGGSKVVRPLGISSFTTVVFDENGKIVARDRPDHPGYVERIRALLDPSPLGAKDVEEVVSAKHDAIRQACWNTRRDVSTADVTVSVAIDGEGRVASATSTGTDKGIMACIEREVRSWRFRPTGRESVRVDIPFKLRRDGADELGRY